MKKIAIYILGIVAVIAITFSIGWAHFLNTPLVTGDKPIELVLKSGSSVKTLAQQLKKQQALKQPLIFELLARLRGDTKNLQAGEYQIVPGTLPNQLLNQIIAGKVMLRSFTVVEGWTFKQLLAELAKNDYVVHTLQNANEEQVMQQLGHGGEVAEGRFFPETYSFASGTKDIEVLQSAYQMMQQKLNALWQTRAVHAKYSCPYKMLIVASIIEKEAALANERSIIADIILKRLAKRMYLQIDPTLMYALGKTKLTRRDLRSTNSYNTYKHRGLPPTPICNPSESALRAASLPAATPYWYYVAKGDGSHVFAKTLRQHNRNVKKYVLR